jgi:amino acid permease
MEAVNSAVSINARPKEASEATPLLRGDDDVESSSSSPSQQPQTSLNAALSNLVLSVLGAGQLSLPHAFRELGLAGGTLSLLFLAALSVHSLRCLGVAADVGTRAASYAELAERTLGRSMRRVLDFLQVVYAWGGAISFMIILKQELGYLVGVLGLAGGGGSGGGGGGSGGGDGSGAAALAVLSAAFLWPLSSLRNVAMLKTLSPLGCLAAVFITATIVAVAPWGGMAGSTLGSREDNGGEGGGGYGGGVLRTCAGPAGGVAPADAPDPGTLQLWPASVRRALAALPLLAFALNSSWSYIPILSTMRGRQHAWPTRAKLAVLAKGFILLNYLPLAGVGYALFCADTDANVLENLGAFVPAADGWRGALVLAARAGLALQLSLALPLRFHVARDCVLDVLLAGRGGGKGKGKGKGKGGFAKGHAPFAYRCAAALLLVGSAAAIASTELPLDTAIGLTSAIAASSIIYIVPSLVDLRGAALADGTPAPRRPWRELSARNAASLLSLAVGAVVLVTGTITNLTPQG